MLSLPAEIPVCLCTQTRPMSRRWRGSQVAVNAFVACGSIPDSSPILPLSGRDYFGSPILSIIACTL